MRVYVNKDIKASLVIPLLNNEKTLVSQLKMCKEILEKICTQYEIIVCDDKSTDSSQQLLKIYFSKDKHFKLIFNKKNIGIAKNVYNLYKISKFEYIVLFSVDGDWYPRDIAKLLLFANKNKADIVIGRRIKKNYGFYRKTISFFYNFLTYLFFQVNTVDAASIKVIRKKIINTTHIISKSIFFEAELIIKAQRKQKKILVLPINFNRKSGIGSGAKLSYVVSSFIDLIKLRIEI